MSAKNSLMHLFVMQKINLYIIEFGNNDKGHKSLMAYLAQAPVKLIVYEPAGGCEKETF
ncbi:hypothetical protein [Cardinium endosymbiont of Oedothorax gibbosus]|uniref:hypothetical protein n=1 Tax=Cardinium endosymbiont of Oedothorax gibbosus TaxID=931101 RepID=UPI002024B729|nr:hypothetical protein [Cardinium endosymbiont of Oedothorax gibbosus]